MELLIFSIALLIGVVVFSIRFFLPRDVRNAVLAEVIHDFLQGIWHFIFGPRKVRVVRDKDRTSGNGIRRVSRRNK